MKKTTIRFMGTITLLACLGWFASCTQDIADSSTGQETQTGTAATESTESTDTASKNEGEDSGSETEQTAYSSEVAQMGNLMQTITFEESEGFSASPSYKYTTPKTLTGTTSTWSLTSGNISTTNSIEGQSLLLRIYDTETPVTATTYTAVSSLCGIVFEAKRGFESNVKASDKAKAVVQLTATCAATTGEVIAEKTVTLTDEIQNISLSFTPVNGMKLTFTENSDVEKSDAIFDNVQFYAQ